MVQPGVGIMGYWCQVIFEGYLGGMRLTSYFVVLFPLGFEKMFSKKIRNLFLIPLHLILNNVPPGFGLR